jgi:hypothetical protein
MLSRLVGHTRRGFRGNTSDLQAHLSSFVGDVLKEFPANNPPVPVEQGSFVSRHAAANRLPEKSRRLFSTKAFPDPDLVSKILRGANVNFVGQVPAGAIGKLTTVVQDRIASSSLHSALGGEKFLTVEHPAVDVEHSLHLMHFSGTQDKHLHGGPRVLVLFAAEEWSLYLGEAVAGKLPASVPVVKIDFPGESVFTLSLKPDVIHGFKGNDLAAFSFHYTDKAEAVVAAASMDNPASITNSHDMMARLTRVVDPAAVDCVCQLSYWNIAAIIGGKAVRAA